MRTAYDVLRRAVIKDFGKWYRKEWLKLSEEAKERVRSGVAYSHFGNPFLNVLHDLYIGENVVRGDLGWGLDFEDNFDALLSQLKVPFIYHWFVYSSFSCDDWFELKGFKSKSAAIDYYKKIKKNRADTIFYTFWFKW